MQKLSLLTRFEREKIVPIHDIELMKSPSIAIERGHLIANPPGSAAFVAAGLVRLSIENRSSKEKGFGSRQIC